MHYNVSGHVVEAELAAKPASQPSSTVIAWVEHLPMDAHVLDYGCGRLRYTIPMARIVRRVTAVDSCYQIQRRQAIAGCGRTTIREYATRYLPNVDVVDVADPVWGSHKYDRVLCANVLSSIPCSEERDLVMRRVRGCLSCRGTLLVTTQYRNSYFSSYGQRRGAQWVEDGWLYPHNGHYYFYGLLPPTTLTRLCLSAGLSVLQVWCHDGSAYVIASSRTQSGSSAD